MIEGATEIPEDADTVVNIEAEEYKAQECRKGSVNPSFPLGKCGEEGKE